LLQTLLQARWLLALCAILDAVISVIYLSMYDTGPDGPLTFHGWNGMAMLSSRLALTAGVCTIAAGFWKYEKGKSWLLVLNGLACSAYGLTPLYWRGALSFDFFALLIVAMAMTAGVLALDIARNLRHSSADAWFFGLAGTSSVAFALAFLALANRWIQLERRPFHPSVFLWLCSYFVFSAICMLGLALRPHRPASSDVRLLGNPRHAH